MIYFDKLLVNVNLFWFPWIQVSTDLALYFLKVGGHTRAAEAAEANSQEFSHSPV